MKNTKKLTVPVSLDIDNKLDAYCKRKGTTKNAATRKAIENMLLADAYLLEVARIAHSESKSNTKLDTGDTM